MKAKRGLALLLIGVLTAGGCGTRADYSILEDLGMTSVVAYDPAPPEDDGMTRIRTTVVMPIVDPKARQDEITLSVVARSSKEAKDIISLQTDRQVVSGQLRSVLFSRTMAEKGLLPYIDSLLRDPQIGTRVKLAIAHGEAGELVETNLPASNRVGRYLDILLDKKARQFDIPQSTIHTWYRDLMDDGIDPALPLLKKHDKGIAISGIGLFRGDKMVAFVEPELSVLYMMLRGRVQTAELVLFLEGDDAEDPNRVSLAFSHIRSKRKVDIRRDPKTDRFQAVITLKMKGDVTEYYGPYRLTDPSERGILGRKAIRKIESMCSEIVKLMQENGADCIGLGQKARKLVSYREWSDTDWPEQFSKMDIKVKVELMFDDLGMFE